PSVVCSMTDGANGAAIMVARTPERLNPSGETCAQSCQKCPPLDAWLPENAKNIFPGCVCPGQANKRQHASPISTGPIHVYLLRLAPTGPDVASVRAASGPAERLVCQGIQTIGPDWPRYSKPNA